MNPIQQVIHTENEKHHFLLQQRDDTTSIDGLLVVLQMMQYEIKKLQQHGQKKITSSLTY